MAALKYRDEHNKVGYIKKPKGSDDYHQVLDFLRASHLRYALTHEPIIFDSLVKQFWSTASLRVPELGSPAILATIDRTPYTITKESVRSHLQLDDDGGVEDLPIADIYLGMDNLGYPTEGKLTFHKNKFSPQWRFLVHTIQHCLSTKTGSWDQLGSPLAVALICLSDGRRFLQIILGIATRNTKQYYVLKLSSKLFANMRLNFEGDHIPLSATMLPPAQVAIADEGTGEAAPDGHSSGPNIASYSRAHESDPDPFTSTNVEDETLVVSKLVQKVSTLESELQAHKLLFKDVVGKLVQKVKALELKLKTRSRKVVLSESDKEEEEDMDPLIKLAKAAAASDANIDVSPLIPTGAPAGVPSGVSTGTSAGLSNKGKSPMLEEDPPVKRRTVRQMEEDKLGEEAAKRIYEEEQADLERQREEMQRKRQQDMLDSAKYYTDADWTEIMGQVHANQGLTSDLLGPDVNEDNFAERMVALIAERRRAFAAQRFQEKRNKPMTYVQQQAFMRTFIRTAVAELQSLTIRRTLKRAGEDLEHASSKKPKSTEVPMFSVPDVPHQPTTEVPPADPHQPSESSSQPNVPSTATRGHSYGTRRKSLGARKKSSTELDLDADDRSFIRVLSDDDDDPVIFWSSKYFTHLRKVLHLVDRQDLLKLYGMVVMYYGDHPLAGAGSLVWYDQQQWHIRSWRLFPLSNVHVLETISGKVVYMFADGSYPLSVQLMKKMLKHKLEIEINGVGNDMTYAEQLIQFIKNQIAASIPSA
ncbi:hypothetical protein Tco_1038458 [Tanacetum coccineum]